MKENAIVVLENNEQYVILNVVKYMNNIYYFAIGINDDYEVIEDKVVFLEEKKENNDSYVCKITDESLLIELIKTLRKK